MKDDPNDDQNQVPLSDDGGAGDESGTEADLESDDNVLDQAHEAGLYEEADEEHPAEIDIAGEIDKAEREHEEED